MLDDMFKSVKAQLYERAVSPLIGSIVISWSLWNYKFILLMVSGLKVTDKYKIIDEVLFTTWQQAYLQGALYPIATAVFYLYLYPYPAKYVFEFTRNRQKEISDIKRKIEDETLLSVKESRAIRREIYALEEEMQKDIERKDSEIERLRKELEDIEKDEMVSNVERQLSDPQSSKPETLSHLSDPQLSMLKLAGEESEPALEKQ